MHRQSLLTLLRNHTPADANEAAMTAQTIAFVEANPTCFERSLAEGHVTGSAWITSPSGSPNEQRVVLIHHRKLDRWFQPGGHADGDPDVAAVALREAQEETGLPDLELVSPAIFDVDVHSIPARGEVGAHLHYDIRFRLKSDEKIIIGENSEVKEIRWLNLDQAEALSDSESVGRMVRKTRQTGQ
ncbi:NUDIX hydrolase [Fibrella sp. HMF5335]|uniref:NUDIX hydrolase n=1 Tax=Fibrella rubiginis TaxID=2817060 RepID=A0A939GLS2_9BACT|nr:NUDIX hydrolase [Fibrella rubiginis]MBO0938718.1 NUDIX hydrolase [Fibrella rubiginis]